MSNNIYISPFRDFKGHIQVMQKGDSLIVSISNENEYLMINNKSDPLYVNNRDGQWREQILVPIQ